MTLRELEIDKPDDLIFSPMRISQAAVYIINAIILNERLGPTDRPEEKRIRVSDIRLIIGAERWRRAFEERGVPRMRARRTSDHQN